METEADANNLSIWKGLRAASVLIKWTVGDVLIFEIVSMLMLEHLLVPVNIKILLGFLKCKMETEADANNLSIWKGLRAASVLIKWTVDDVNIRNCKDVIFIFKGVPFHIHSTSLTNVCKLSGATSIL